MGSQNSGELRSARPANAVCSLPRLRGRGGERVIRRESFRMPSPYPSPASGGGNTPSARLSGKRGEGTCRASANDTRVSSNEDEGMTLATTTRESNDQDEGRDRVTPRW
jgi:hypothetical protein